MIKSAGIAFVLICVFSVWGHAYGYFAVIVAAMLFGACLADWMHSAVTAVLQKNYQRLASHTLAFSTFLLPAYAYYLSGIRGVFAPALFWGSIAMFYRMFYENTKQDRPKPIW